MSYDTEVLADSPRVYYRFDEASGLPQDSSGNALHISVVEGTPTYSQVGPITSDTTNLALLFDGTTEYLRRTDNALLDLADIFTMEAWVKRSSIGVAGRGIISKGNNAYYMRIEDTDRVELLKSNAAVIVASTNTITDTTTWHHIACTKNGVTSKQYVDGVDVTGVVTNATCADNIEELTIGADQAGANLFAGTIARPAVYPTALTQARLLVHIAAATATAAGVTAVSWLRA